MYASSPSPAQREKYITSKRKITPCHMGYFFRLEKTRKCIANEEQTD